MLSNERVEENISFDVKECFAKDMCELCKKKKIGIRVSHVIRVDKMIIMCFGLIGKKLFIQIKKKLPRVYCLYANVDKKRKERKFFDQCCSFDFRNDWLVVVVVLHP